MRTYANLLVISFEKKLMPGWKVVPNKVEMHTDGKPRVVRVCDVGVSKGCVCFFFSRWFKDESFEDHKQTKKKQNAFK
jgi:hypothetical protein